jgi:hypothetical protein
LASTVAADFDGDGDQDIFLGNSNTHGYALTNVDGLGTFATGSGFTNLHEISFSRAIAVGDIVRPRLERTELLLRNLKRRLIASPFSVVE